MLFAYQKAPICISEWIENPINPGSTMPAFTPHPTSGTSASATNRISARSSTNAGSGYPYRDASQYRRPRTDVPWLQLMLVPANTPPIAFEYSLSNEYLTTRNDVVPIQGGKKTLNFRCSPSAATCTGDIAGGPWSAGSPYTTKGSGFSDVELKLYFTSTPAAP
jgi:hypothetical protein